MKYFKLILFLSIGFHSCSGPSCDCDLLFKDKDSLVNISASSNPEVQELISIKYDLKNKYEKLRLQAKKEDENDVGDLYEDESTKTKFIIELQEIKKRQMETEIQLQRIVLRSPYQKTDLKIVPYTGTCFRKGEDQEIYYQAEYENGKLISEEWIK